MSEFSKAVTRVNNCALPKGFLRKWRSVTSRPYPELEPELQLEGAHRLGAGRGAQTGALRLEARQVDGASLTLALSSTAERWSANGEFPDDLAKVPVCA